MKNQMKAWLLLGGLLGLAPAQAAWTDWFDGLEGAYAGASLGVTRINGQLNRRLGGANDPGGFFIEEPGFNTTAMLQIGFLPSFFPYLGIEAQYGTGIESDRIENADNSQKINLDSIYGIYLKPQITYADSITLYGSAGLADFDYQIDHSTLGRRSFSDSGFAWAAGIRLQLSATGTLSFEYNQYFDEDDVEVFGIGIKVDYWFGVEDDGGGDFY